MDPAGAQLMAALITAAAAIVAAAITAYATLRAARTGRAERGETPAVRRSNQVALAPLVYGLLCIPLGFVIAYIGNYVQAGQFRFKYDLVGDCIDPALVSGLTGFAGWLIGKAAYKAGASGGHLVLLALVLGLCCIPVSYAIAYLGNSLSGVPEYRLFSDSADSALVGALLFTVGFGLGSRPARSLSAEPQRSDANDLAASLK